MPLQTLKMEWGGNVWASHQPSPFTQPRKYLGSQHSGKFSMQNSGMSWKALNAFHRSLRITAKGSSPTLTNDSTALCPPSAIQSLGKTETVASSHPGLLWAASLSQGAFLGLHHGSGAVTASPSSLFSWAEWVWWEDDSLGGCLPLYFWLCDTFKVLNVPKGW